MFDEMKIKSLLKKELDKDTYLGLSDKIRNDSRIIQHFIENNLDNINFLSQDILLKLVTNNYQLSTYLNKENINEVFSELDLSLVPLNQDMYNLLSYYNQELLFKHSPLDFVNFATEERTVEMVSEVITTNTSKKNNEYYDESYFMDDAKLRSLILNLKPDTILSLLSVYDNKDVVLSIIDSLSEEEQIRLYNSNSEFFKYISKDAKESIEIQTAGNDLIKISLMSLSAQEKFFENNVDLLCYAPNNTVYNFLNDKDVSLTYEQFRKAIFNKNVGLGTFARSVDKFLTLDEQLELFSNDFSNIFSYVKFSENENSDNLSRLVMAKINAVSDSQKRNELIELYNGLDDKRIVEGDPYIYHNTKYQISRMIFDDKIIENNDVDLLKEYRNTFNREILVEILTNAYGKHVEDIFKERPNLDLLNIENFKIFDKNIVDNLGLGFVNYCLSYNLGELQELISVLSKDEKMMENFKKFFGYCLENESRFDVGVMTDILTNFGVHEELISSIDFESLTDVQKNNLKLIMGEPNNVSLSVRTIDDIDLYLDKRRTYFIDLLEKQEYPSDLQNHIFEYLTGRTTVSEPYTLDNLAITNAVEIFNVEHIVHNKELIGSMNLNSDEVALLLLLHQVETTYNMEVLKDTFTAITNSALSPVMFQSTFDKIRDYYTEAFKSNLTSIEKINEMEKDYIDDTPVVSFEGEPFNIICSMIGLNLSQSYGVRKSIYGAELLNDWLNREKGSSSISTTLCSSDVSIYPGGLDLGGNDIVFAFNNDIDIIAMGGSDISYTHSNNSKRHSFQYIGSNKMRFASMDEIKSDMVGSIIADDAKFPSEIVATRKEEDIRKVSGIQKRTMPIGLYIVGEPTEEMIETAKAFNEYYKNNNMGEFLIIKIDPQKYPSVPTMFYKSSSPEKVESSVEWYQDANEHIGGKRG